MNGQKGFTLPEILTVTSVMVVLAVVSVPRFAALNSETRLSSVTALAIHVENSAKLTNRVWESAGHPSQIVIDGRIIAMQNGYPTDQSIGNVVIDGGNYLFNDGYWKHLDTSRDQRCAVLYIPPAVEGGQFQVIPYTTDC